MEAVEKRTPGAIAARARKHGIDAGSGEARKDAAGGRMLACGRVS